jgi:hypothetical protein
MSKIQIEAQLNVGVRWDQAARVFVSYAPALDIYSQGPTEQDAVRAIEGAMRMYIVTALETNKLDRVLERLGARTSGIGPEASEYIKVVPHGGNQIRAKLIPSEVGLR